MIVLGITQVDRFYGLGSARDDIQQGDISVLSYNTQGLFDLKSNSSDFLEIIDVMRSTDIILLQEVGGDALEKIQQHLPSHQLYKSPDVHLAVLTKAQISGGGLVNKENASNGSIWVDLKINQTEIRAYNTHLQSYRVARTASDIIDKGELGDDKTWSDIKYILGLIKTMSKRRSNQVDEISEHIHKTSKKIILAGDFNDTPVSNTYYRLAGKLTDTFSATGKGVGTTYAGKIPLLRIDYIFADPKFEAVQHTVINNTISDHYPIRSIIRIAPES